MSSPSETVVKQTSRFKAWWNKAVTVRVKALMYSATVLVILFTSFQIQTVQINAARIKDVEAAQVRTCKIKIETRETIRNILFYVVNLNDVLPGNEDAEAYTANRVAFINATYPSITEKDC